MSLRRFANRRDASEPDIVDALRDIGCQVQRLDKPVDLLVKFRGTVHLLEVHGGKRTGTGARTEEQKEFIRDWRVPVVATVDDALRAIGASRVL